ncbi:Aminopeptidase 2 mitochondrial [Ceratobasidium sp. 392]|nr:Aminopeptidase 2 mitochondrial [Ceratobasidium sp. 392]
MSAPAQSTPAKSAEEYRLPKNVRPSHYDLTIQTDLEALTFKGFVIVDLDIVEETKSITFNSSDLVLHEEGLTVTSDALKTEQTQSAKLASVDQKSERATVQLATPLPEGSKAKLRIGYEGKLTGSMLGYYYSSAPHEGKPRNYTLTQFEPTAARRAYPAWDEPALKATYSITLISREDTVSLSNMPAISEKPFVESEVTESEKGGVGKLVKMKMKTKVEGGTINKKGWKITTFEKTPPISSYLVAFANGHFEHLESSYTSPLSGKTRPLRIYATKDIIHQAQFALDVKAKVLPIYEKVFDVEYPLPKLDTLVANDFDAGAMENWGLITGHRFLSTGDASEAENKTIWHVPLSLLTTDANGKKTVDHGVVLSEREADIKLDTSKPWKLNAGTVGVFRTAYTPERLAKLGEEAARENSAFGLEDRVGLVSDAMVLARAGYGKTSGGLSLISCLRGETEHLVWEGIASHLNTLEKVWWEQPKETIDTIKAFRRYLFAPLVKKLGYEFAEDDAPDVRQLRALAITQASTADDKSVLEELRSRFAHFHETGDDSKIHADLQRITYRIAVQHGGEKEYEAIKKIAENPPTPSAKIAAMLAMTQAQDKSLTEKTLQYMLTSAGLSQIVKDQDMMYYFAGLSSNRASRRRIAEFFKENYEKLYKRFEGNFSLSYLVKYGFDSFSSEADAQNVENFFKDKDTSKFNLALAQTLDSIRASDKWLNRSKEDVAQWLAEWQKTTGA